MIFTCCGAFGWSEKKASWVYARRKIGWHWFIWRRRTEALLVYRVGKVTWQMDIIRGKLTTFGNLHLGNELREKIIARIGWSIKPFRFHKAQNLLDTVQTVSFTRYQDTVSSFFSLNDFCHWCVVIPLQRTDRSWPAYNKNRPTSIKKVLGTDDGKCSSGNLLNFGVWIKP